MAEAPTRLPLCHICMGVCGLLGHHAAGGLGKLRPRALWDFMHFGLVAGTGIRVWSELCLVHPVLLSRPPHGRHCLFLRHDHLQSQVYCQGDVTL